MAVPTTTPMLFGAYIQNISTSMGWGGQGGSCQLTLVEDPDNGVNISLPTVGTAAGLSYGKFYFGGIFQRYTYKEALSGRTYDVVLESPAKLLDGIQVILDEFQGTIFTPANAFWGKWDEYRSGTEPTQFFNYVTNVWNPFAELENYAMGGNFGNADVNSAGMPVTKLLDVLQDFGNGNGIFGPVKGKAAYFGDSAYSFDFSELIDAVNQYAPYYRVKGPTQNLNGLLADICETIQHEYFPQIIGGTDAIAEPTIKIRMLNMGSQPSPGIIQDFVDTTKASGKLMSSSVGKEFQSATTQKVVVGGPASRWYAAPVGKFISVWGKGKGSGQFLTGGLAINEYTNESHKNQISLQFPDEFGTKWYNCAVFELRMALGGMETWTTYKAFQTMLEANGGDEEPNRDLYIGDYPPWTSQVFTTQAMLQNLADGGAMADAIDMVNTSMEQVGQAYNKIQTDLNQKMFNVVNKAASEYYGQQFFVQLPYEAGGFENNLRWITEDSQYEASWQITDSAWYYDLNGVESSPVLDVSAYDGTGRLKSHSTWINDGISDFSPFGGDYSFGFGGLVCTSKGGPDGDIYWRLGIGDNDGPSALPYALVRTGAQVRAYDSFTTPDQGLTVLANLFFDLDINPFTYGGLGKQSAQISIPPSVSLPAGIGVPQQSNRYLYGPWYYASSWTGNAEVIMDSSLTPETFGSSEILNQVGLATAFAGLGRMEAVESGMVEVAEFPEFNVGDRFAETGPYVTNLSIAIATDGCKCTYKFNTWTPNFGKLTKYNVDRISRIRKGGIAFAQRERSKRERKPFPKFGFKRTSDGGFGDLIHEMYVRMGADAFSQMISMTTGN